ncbi:MAG: hypothetical protein JW880_04865 [Candidatus Thermoplasmatota archaeon]|nr:hypothetical protein [Candidatus Thermoplasmatota archaeon]
MRREKCPLCESECIVKRVAMEDEKWREVDVCSLCGAMYPRGRTVVQIKPKEAKAGKAKKVSRPKRK